MALTGQQPAVILTAPAPRGGCPFDPPPAYEQAREKDPVTRVSLWDGSSCWLLTRHQDVRSVLRDTRFSAEASRPGFPFLTAGRKALTTHHPSFIRMDDPEHAQLRRMLTGDFMVKRIEALRPRIQQLTDGLLDRMTEGRREADLVADFALPLPSVVICLLLGVPYEDHAFFQDRSRTLLHHASSPEQIGQAQDDLLRYLARLADAKAAAPDDGILSRLAGRGELTADQTAAMARLLLVAGHETTANMTALSVLALLRNPDQLARPRDAARAGDSAAVQGAVEELLRYLTIVQGGVARVATEDVTVGGTPIRAGEGVLCMLSAANRDEDAFPGGDALDVSRDARRHVAFGFGVHQCLGQPLARVELQVALSSVLRRLPGLRLAVPFEQIRFRTDMLVYGVHTLPVAW
ncbi:Cytochrome P450 [Streptomyces sp. DvalAA-14]|uniref:cytochrome P450 n=1 Tax=unclassified Streptomyces TaxID=2593676 RepID=UPI00081B902A|nr:MULTISPECIES: cytochrome P450 [unclassified Streptomyces]MYS23074.1 cytochrome P450 [Streptomyces sp. SID4948]SCE26950.1 Cytochrome P450 [Streptomyces sp. DvalAA-14]